MRRKFYQVLITQFIAVYSSEKITKIGQYLSELSKNKSVSFFYGPRCICNTVLTRQNLDNNCVWNVFSQVIAMSQNVRHNKFCLRLAMKVSHVVPIIVTLSSSDKLLVAVLL